MEKLRPNSDIEILRAFAIIMVLVQHFPSLYFWSDHTFFASINRLFSFWGGVDLFFCISGYVVSMSIMRSVDSNKEAGTSNKGEIKAFYIKRLFRLMPTSIFWVVIMLIMTATYNISGAFGKMNLNIYQALSVITYNYNVVSAIMSDAHLQVTFGPYWSLSLEEQFYIVFPLFLLLTPREKRTAVIAIMLFVLFFIHRQGNMTFNFRIDAMLWGVLIATWSLNGTKFKHEPMFMSNRILSIFFTMALILLLMIRGDYLNSSRFLVGYLSLVSFFFVYIASFNKGYIYCPSAVRKFFLWIGARSYAIYIIHMPVIYFVQETTVRHYVSIGEGPSKSVVLCAVMTISAIALTAILSELNFRLIEVPLRNYGRKLANRVLAI